GRAIRLAPITTEGAAESLGLLGASKADLAVARADLDMPGIAETVAIVRNNFVVLWSPSGSGKGAGKKSAPKIEELARDPAIDAFMAVGPLDSKITSEAIAATAKTRGEPKFLAIDASEAIALKHPLYESEEIPPSVFNPSPAWPDDKVETVSISHVIVARKSLSETTVAGFVRQLFAVRQSLAKQVPGAAHLKKPDTDKDAELPVHRGAAAFIDGNERTFLDKYSDYFWFALLL